MSLFIAVQGKLLAMQTAIDLGVSRDELARQWAQLDAMLVELRAATAGRAPHE